MSDETILRIVIQVVIHLATIELFIWLARKQLWIIPGLLAGAIAGFIIFVLVTISPPAQSELVTVSGPLQSYDVNPDGEPILHILDDPRTFEIPDVSYFEQAAFTQTVHAGDTISLAILGGRQNATKTFTVFELTAQGHIYLSAEPILASRRYEYQVMMPIGLAIALSVTGISLWAFFFPRRVCVVPLGMLIGTLALLILEFYFSRSQLSGFVTAMTVLIAYPIIWRIESLRHRRTRSEDILSLIFYGLSLLFAVLTLVSFW